MESFPYPVIQTIVGPPTYESLLECHIKISSNTASMKTNLGSGDICFLALLVTNMVYYTLSNTTFTAPISTGASLHIPSKYTGIKKIAVRYKFKADTKLYHISLKFNKSLKHHILGVFDNLYVCALKYRIIGYDKFTCLHIITRVKANYYHITSADLKANHERIITIYNVNLPFKQIIKHIKLSVKFSDAGNVPYTPLKVASAAYKLIFAVGYFNDACHFCNSEAAA